MSKPQNVRRGDDGVRRCWWCGEDPLYMQYHDDEWGIPVDDDQRLFEKLCLEGFQAGLSWITILKKREAFRAAFSQFDYHKVAKFSAAKVNRLLQNAEIVRHRGKVESTINNARRAIDMVERQGSLARFVWQFAPQDSPVIRARENVLAKTDESTAMSKELKRHGWSFVGPTTCYAFMQSMGMVNDHIKTCDSWSLIDQARANFSRPDC